jgi:dihydroorotate dehydrogenase
MNCPVCGYSTDKKQRSNNQNRYYHGVVVKTLSEHTGFTSDEMHEVLKHKFLKTYLHVVNKKGSVEEVQISKSTKDLNTKEFEDYMTKVREWASIELGCWIPEPNEELTNV